MGIAQGPEIRLSRMKSYSTENAYISVGRPKTIKEGFIPQVWTVESLRGVAQIFDAIGQGGLRTVVQYDDQ